MKLFSAIRRLFASDDPAISDTRNPRMWLVNGLGGRRTTAGENVSHETALTLSAYWACLRVISEDVAKIPLHVYRERPGGGKDKATDHPVYRLLHRAPNPDMTPMALKETMVSWAQAWGGGVAEIERRAGRPAALWPIHPSRVRIDRDEKRRLWYFIKSEIDGGTREVAIPARNILHIHGLGPNGVTGYSVLQMAAESIGLGLALQRFGSAYFGNGTAAAGVLKHPNTLSDEAIKHLRETWAEKHSGPENAHKPMILEEGMEWHTISVPPEQAQFLESRKFTAPEMCRWFRLAPHKIQDLERATFSNIEDQSLNHLGDALDPWLVRFEEECNRKLFLDSEADLFVRFNRNSTMRADHDKRSSFYDRMWKIGALSQNEIREFEDMNPIDDGDTYYIPTNNMAPAGAPPSGEAPADGNNDTDNESGDSPFGASDIAMKASARLFADAAGRLIRREMKAIRREATKHHDHDEFASVAGSFCQTCEPIIIESVEPIIESGVEILTGSAIGVTAEVVREHSRTFARTYTGDLLANAVQAHRVGGIDEFCDRWEARKPSELSDQLCGIVTAIAEGTNHG